MASLTLQFRSSVIHPIVYVGSFLCNVEFPVFGFYPPSLGEEEEERGKGLALKWPLFQILRTCLACLFSSPPRTPHCLTVVVVVVVLAALILVLF